jgi:type VI protein secretion system component Hcp
MSVLLLALPAHAQAPVNQIFMRIDGIRYTGQPLDDKHRDWFDVMETSTEVTIPPPASGVSQRPAFSPFVVSLGAEKVPPQIYLFQNQGRQIQRVEFEVTEPANPRAVIKRVTLENVLITRLSPRWHATGRVVEMTLSFNRFRSESPSQAGAKFCFDALRKTVC